MERFERAIILEDDCLPHPTFFPYCDELLERYAEDPRIFSVTGHNFLRGRRRRNDDSYYFSRYTQMWGWATWRRAWKHYDVKAGIWPEVRDGGWLRELLTDPRDLAYWSHMFQGVYDGYDTWDYQWFLAAWANNALAIMPSVNLITNIGFGAEATHTISRDVEVADMPAEAMAFPLKHPRIVMRDVSADEQMKRIAHSLPTTWMKIQRRLRRILGRRNK